MIRLDGGGETLVLHLAEGPPVLAYWGPTLSPAATPEATSALTRTATPHGMLDEGETLDLLPEAGRGFTGWPALSHHRADGRFISQLRRVALQAETSACIVTLADPAAGIEVELSIRLDPATGVAAFRSRLTNTGSTPLAVDWMSPCALACPHDELMLMEGRWSREFHTVRQRLAVGLMAKENRTGRTSHHSPPFMAAGTPGFSQQAGSVLGLHLAWSGDHRLLAERLRDGRIQLQAGELFLPGELILAPGESYQTPMLYAARSDSGLNGLSDRFHPFVRDQILGGRLRARHRPVHFNTWEAVYFRHDMAELKQLADLAAQVGAERFILDDGWFKGRHDDTTSLGDWITDAVKYPEGLGPLIDHVRGLGLEFGLWVEPEMANLDSDLIRAHPDWILGEPGRRQPVGRGQYVLDLTRPEVFDHILAQLDRLLAEHAIGYLKWDMNRDLTHPASLGRPASHRRTQAAYALMDRLRAAHPGVEIESCASGGARADFEILRRTERIWTSDCIDPLERQAIQRGFSVFFPPEVMGTHVGAETSHTTGRRTGLDLRLYTALFGHMGIEADIRAFPEAHRVRLAAAIALHKQVRPWLHAARTLRLDHPDPGAVAFLAVGQDQALASLAQLEVPQHAAPPPLRLTGLDPDRLYRVRLVNPPVRPGAAMKRWPDFVQGGEVTAPGRMLEVQGLPMPVLKVGDIVLAHLVLAD